MEKYRFILEIPANTEAEAKAKLDLMLELGIFFKEFDASHLTRSLVFYLLHHYAGKYCTSPNDSKKQ